MLVLRLALLVACCLFTYILCRKRELEDPHSTHPRKLLAETDLTIEVQVSADGEPTYLSAIPRTIFIIHKYDLCNVTTPSYLQFALSTNDPFYFQLMLNVQKIKAFHPDFDVICFDDESALDYIANVRKDSAFAAHVRNERSGPYKSDLFRIFLLFHEGGFYFDSDMEPRMSINEVLSSSTAPITFISAIADDKKSIFQSILGATKANPILKQNLDIFEQHFKVGKKPPRNMGTVYLYEALSRVLSLHSDSAAVRSGELQIKKGQQIVRLLEERKYGDVDADDILSQRKAGKSWDYIFGYALYDPVTGKYPFWSRFTGYGNAYFRQRK